MDAAAAGAHTITYSELLAVMESSARPNSRSLTDLLCEISETTLTKEGILLSAVVVNAGGKRKGIPGPGFVAFAKRKGFDMPEELDIPEERRFWKKEVAKVYSARGGVPTISAFPWDCPDA